MKDWKTLLGAPRFRAYWMALLTENLGNWCVIAALPILVAERFGPGMEMVLSLALRVVPKLVLAPLAAGLMRRFGPARLASAAMLMTALLTALLPWCRSILELQTLVCTIGTLDLFIMPGLLALRAPLTPPGLEMQSNMLCSVADRVAKIAGPAIGGLAITAGPGPAFLGFGVLIAASAIPVACLPGIAAPADKTPRGGLPDFVRLVRNDHQIGALLIIGLTYMVLLGGLQPFLFWANRDWYGGSDAAWTGLLAAQGAGALAGALVSAFFMPRLLRGMSAYRLLLISGIMEGVFHLLLLLAGTGTQAIGILAAAGIPEIIATAAWFTAVQVRLSAGALSQFYSFALPLWDVFFTLGIISAGLHAEGMMSLTAYWVMISLIATLPILPFLWFHRRA
jgi:MFS family permease